MHEVGRYFAKLDGLRALAVFGVLISHFYPKDTALWHAFPYGRTGVVLFFVLSGFLIVNILLTMRERIKGGARFGDEYRVFLGRRAIRILPVYFGIVFFFCAIGYSPVRSVFWWHATYSSNLGNALYGLNFANLSHFWSLCIEEQFYLISPLCILLLPIRVSMLILVVVSIIGTASGVFLEMYSSAFQRIVRLTFFHLDGLTYGALIAYSIRIPRIRLILEKIGRLWLLWLCVLAFFAMYKSDIPNYASTINMVLTLVLGSVIFWIVYGRFSWPMKFLEWKPLRYLGKISYGVYAYHYALIPFIPAWLASIGINVATPDQNIFSFLMSVLLSYCVAIASWHFFESPILGLKVHFTARSHRHTPEIA
jgi:peptidoglycan/LPS O-acetylase OafA/YrhL